MTSLRIVEHAKEIVADAEKNGHLRRVSRNAERAEPQRRNTETQHEAHQLALIPNSMVPVSIPHGSVIGWCEVALKDHRILHGRLTVTQLGGVAFMLVEAAQPGTEVLSPVLVPMDMVGPIRPMHEQIIRLKMKTTQHSVEQIQLAVTKYFKLHAGDMTSRCREERICVPRMIAMTLCREATDHSLNHLGMEFGGRDHGTVLHAVRMIHGREEVDHQLRLHVFNLRDELGIPQPGTTPQLSLTEGTMS
jgi:hypothetical protein